MEIKESDQQIIVCHVNFASLVLSLCGRGYGVQKLYTLTPVTSILRFISIGGSRSENSSSSPTVAATTGETTAGWNVELTWDCLTGNSVGSVYRTKKVPRKAMLIFSMVMKRFCGSITDANKTGSGRPNSPRTAGWRVAAANMIPRLEKGSTPNFLIMVLTVSAKKHT